MRARGTGTARGFTLVEVMVAAVITAVLMGVLYNVFYTTTQQSHRMGARYQAMQSALTAAEIVSRELDRLVTLPIEKDARGYVVPRFGDHARPLRVAEDGRGISFFVPGARDPAQDATRLAASPLTIDLVPGPVPGTYVMRRSEGAEAAAGADGGAAGEATGEGTRTYRGVQLKTLRFRLLTPDAELPALRSPDDTVYLEAVLVGTDARGQEESPLSVLEPLVFPSERRYDPALSSVEYVPTGPLAPPQVALNPSPEEAAAATALTELADAWRAGTLGNEELVEKAREALAPVAGKTPTGALTTRRPRIAAVPPDAQVLTPRDSGVPVIGSPSGQGPITMLPPAGGSQPGAPGGGPGDGNGTYTFWASAKVYDANGNVVWQDGYSGDGEMAADGSDWGGIKQGLDDRFRGLEGDMNAVSRTFQGARP